VLISLFGIFAISASTVGQRRKEIAVRKVMGATAKNVVDMFFREYIWLVGIAAIVAFPFFYYTISRWLEQFAYHIHISIGIYLALACITVVLVLLTVCNQVIQAANENPADVVKSE
jgi:ABC-type antimicrobial peptide transport system permease subunit